jgi:hypothetical protein
MYLIKDHIAKIEKCLLSARDKNQLSSCYKMIKNYETKFNHNYSISKIDFLEGWFYLVGLHRGRAHQFRPDLKDQTIF